MRNILLALILVLTYSAIAFAQTETQSSKVEVTTTIDSTIQGELTLIHEVFIKAPVEKVWDAYTTSKGWQGWVAPLAKVDFKIHGTILTNYNPEGSLDDNTTNKLHIVNYVPYRMLTLQAELTKNFPQFMQEDAEKLYNVIYFERMNQNVTKITSYGIGYRNTPKYNELMQFFIAGNEKTFLKLIAYLEGGEK